MDENLERPSAVTVRDPQLANESSDVSSSSQDGDYFTETFMKRRSIRVVMLHRSETSDLELCMFIHLTNSLCY